MMKSTAGVRTDSSIGMRGVFRLSVKSRRFLRPLIGVVVAYSVAAQSLLIALGGFTLPAQADDGTPAFELCLHDGQGAPELPTSNPARVGPATIRENIQIASGYAEDAKALHRPQGDVLRAAQLRRTITSGGSNVSCCFERCR